MSRSPSARPQPSERQVARAYRALADEHVAQRRDDSEAVWQRLEGKQRGLVLLPGRGSRVFGAPSGWLAGWRGVALGASLAAAAAVAWAIWPRSLSYEVVGGTQSGGLVATEDTSAALLFSEDSRVDVAPHTTLRVNIEGKQRLVARLGQGELDVHVVHRAETDYRFWAGPYEVLVVGTAFRLEFEPKGELMELELREGKVRIFDAHRRVLEMSAGQTVKFAAGRSELSGGPFSEQRAADQRAADQRSADLRSADLRADESGNAQPKGLPNEGQPSESPQSEPRVQGAANAPGAVGYASLAQVGRFSEIVEQAQRTGVERVLREKSSAELQSLAQAANYTGNQPLATRTWKAMQARFAGSAAGANAAFFLGRQSDQAGRRAEALGYFDSYLAQAPRGTYAAEALGRKLLLVDRARASQLAREYLIRFPRGAYAEKARQLVDGG
ncbi:MAG TPA: FecR domain-containing protein [Polyangiaceae bacterium]|nr:FecR domain-containing protein [Polyangiaceae bacterium]